MRRRALTLLCTATIGLLTACTNGYGGSSLGSNSNQPSAIAFTNASGSYVSFFKIAPNSSAPLTVTAVSAKGGEMVQPQASFTWSIRYGTTADTYQLVNTRTGLITYPSCPAVAASANVAASALAVQSSRTTASTVAVLPSALAAPRATAPVGSGTAASPVYCLVLTATKDDVSAPVTVLVSNN